ncbi:hypothetical protein DAEQUDRAFT_808431 [Daedalea quercina L-15889]|uniref:Uncharacterized protein n=1 Tax=Daedalea quercina L-15889 TaxID=1314783 RepID=A0A165TER1_9APHY|nr:hypothetical protein DAEQUDRAFT_808431 [Daedalea quercina L-15889]
MFARPVRAVSLPRALIRFNSSVAPAASAEKGEQAAPKRSIPKAIEFGDIKIENVDKNNASLSWVGNLALQGGDGLSARLARRRKQQQTSEAASSDAASDAALNADATQRVHKSSVSDDAPRPTRDARSSTPRGERRQGSANRGEGAQARSGERAPRPWGGNSATRVSGRDSQNRAPRRMRERSSVEESPGGEEPAQALNVEAVIAQAQRHVGKIAASTFDLDKLFGATISAEATGVATVKPRAQNVQNDAVARRVQNTLERRGGDYSRWMPDDLGTSFPEQLGPLGSARLILAHRRDVGFKSRERALGTVQSLVVNKVVENGPAANA